MTSDQWDQLKRGGRLVLSDKEKDDASMEEGEFTSDEEETRYRKRERLKQLEQQRRKERRKQKGG